MIHIFTAAAWSRMGGWVDGGCRKPYPDIFVLRHASYTRVLFRKPLENVLLLPCRLEPAQR